MLFVHPFPSVFFVLSRRLFSVLRRRKTDAELDRIHYLLNQVSALQFDLNFDRAKQCFQQLQSEHGVVASNMRRLWRGDAAVLHDLVQKWEIQADFGLDEERRREERKRRGNDAGEERREEDYHSQPYQAGALEPENPPTPPASKRPRTAPRKATSHLLAKMVGTVTLEMM